MGPSNHHEVAIARIVERLDTQGSSVLTSIEDVITVLDFTMSKSDSQFLVEYIRWRMDHPSVK